MPPGRIKIDSGNLPFQFKGPLVIRTPVQLKATHDTIDESLIDLMFRCYKLMLFSNFDMKDCHFN